MLSRLAQSTGKPACHEAHIGGASDRAQLKDEIGCAGLPIGHSSEEADQ